MTLKKIIFIFFIVLGLGTTIGIFLFHHGKKTADTEMAAPGGTEDRFPHHPNTRVGSKAKPGEDRTLLHTLADPEKREAYKNQPITSWDEWVKALTEIRLGSYVEEGLILTPNELVSKRKIFFQHFTWQSHRYKKKNHPVPATAIELPYLDESKHYEGPQTVEAIMAEYDAPPTYYEPRAEELEETYPRADFLQRVLDKGAVIKNGTDYAYWIKITRQMLLSRRDHPDDWRSGSYGIPITTDFTEYEEGFLQRKIWENKVRRQVSETNPGESFDVYFPASHPDVYLPVIGKMTYAHRDKYGGLDTFGTALTENQHNNLFQKGIEPDGIEIVYIDEDYNVLSEPPPIVTLRDLIIRSQKHAVEFKGIPLTSNNYESVVGHPAPIEWLEEYEARQTRETQETTHDPDAARREAALAAQAAAKAEYEKFENRMRQIEEFSTMSNAEIEKSLERQFRKQFLPEHPVEKLELITPERLERALGTLFQHGFVKGIQRIRKDNAVLADMLVSSFGTGKQPPPKVPKRPAPPEKEKSK